MATPLPALPGDQPVLLVPALREIYVTDEVRAALAERLGGRLEVHDVDCGHMVYWEAFDELAGALRGFLAG